MRETVITLRCTKRSIVLDESVPGLDGLGVLDVILNRQCLDHWSVTKVHVRVVSAERMNAVRCDVKSHSPIVLAGI